MNINNINSGLNLDKSLISNKNIEFQKDLKDKLESEITKDGILLKFKDEEKLIKIEGDVNNIKVANQFERGMGFGVLSSTLVGVIKALGVVFLNGLYPLVPAIYKYIDSYKKVKEEAKEMVNNGNECEVSNAALKGGILGAAKGLVHGILDLAVIGSLTALGGSVLGPIGFALASFIGPAYNIAKDDIRLKLEGSKNTGVGLNSKNNETKENNKEKDPEEPFFPFPPKK
jgi:hypothetical protein